MITWRPIRAGITTILLICSCGHFTPMSAQAAAQQTVSVLTPQLDQDNKGLSAALITFKKNYGGIGSFLRSPQTAEPPVLHVIDDLQKRLGKDMTAREPADIREIAAAVEGCISYLSSPNLVSYSEPTVAQQIRSHANSTLKNMNEVSSSTTGLELNALLARVNEDLLQPVVSRTTGDQGTAGQETQIRSTSPMAVGGGTGGVFRPDTNGVGHASCIYCPDPKYSEEAKNAKYQGTVVLQATITADGRAIDIEVVKEPGLDLGEKAVEAVSQWRFNPALGPGGKPVAVKVPIEITFRLVSDASAQAQPSNGGHAQEQELQQAAARSATEKQAISENPQANAHSVQAIASDAAAIPGRISSEQLRAIFAAADEEDRRGFSDESARTSIHQVEGALDQDDLARANHLYQQFAAVASLPPFAQSYLQQTQSLRFDLRTLGTYAEAVQLGHRNDGSLLQRVKNLALEADLLHASASAGRPLTKKYLEDVLAGDTEAVRHQLLTLLALHFDETSYRIPSGLSDRDRLALVSNQIKKIDDSLALVAEARSIAAQPDAMKAVEQLVGSNAADKLAATAVQTAAGERVRATLMDAQTSIQAKIEAHEREVAQAQEAEQARIARVEQQRPTMEKFASQLKVIHGRRFKVVNAGVGDTILQDMLDKIPQNQFVDLIAMYTAITGIDGSTTSQALAKCRSKFIGKFYVLQGDVFQIQADRDYPREGLNEFSLFGQVNLVDGRPRIPINIQAISAEKVPPYQLSPVLGKIVDFKLGTNRAGKAIIVPVVRVVAVLGTHPYSNEDEEIIINQQ